MTERKTPYRTRMHTMARLDMWMSANALESYLGRLFGEEASVALHRINGNRYLHRIHLDGYSFGLDSWQPYGNKLPKFRVCDQDRQAIRQAYADALAQRDYEDWMATRRDAALVGAP